MMQNFSISKPNSLAAELEDCIYSTADQLFLSLDECCKRDNKPAIASTSLQALPAELEELRLDNIKLQSTIKCMEMQWHNEVLAMSKQLKIMRIK